METLMSEALQTFNHPTCETTPNATSSLASEVGASPCSLPDGPQKDLFGQALAPASHSAPQEKASRKRTSAISGPCSSISFASAALSMSLGSRLQTRLGTDGSMEYRQTWKQKATPAGRPYWAHIPSTHPINDKGSTGWPTPTVDDSAQVTRASGQFQSLTRIAQGTTPSSSTAETVVEACAGYPSPGASDGSGGKGPIKGASLTGRMPDGSKVTVPLPTFVKLAHGLTTASPLVETEKPAASQLNPHFSRWLMGFPPEWCDCAVMAMQSFPSVRKSSSKRS